MCSAGGERSLQKAPLHDTVEDCGSAVDLTHIVPSVPCSANPTLPPWLLLADASAAQADDDGSGSRALARAVLLRCKRGDASAPPQPYHAQASSGHSGVPDAATRSETTGSCATVVHLASMPVPVVHPDVISSCEDTVAVGGSTGRPQVALLRVGQNDATLHIDTAGVSPLMESCDDEDRCARQLHTFVAAHCALHIACGAARTS